MDDEIGDALARFEAIWADGEYLPAPDLNRLRLILDHADRMDRERRRLLGTLNAIAVQPDETDLCGPASFHEVRDIARAALHPAMGLS